MRTPKDLRGAAERVGALSHRGNLGTRLNTSHIERPDLLEADFRKRCVIYDTRNQLADAPTDEGLLDAFLRLHDATDQQIAEFASKYGVLRLDGFRNPGIYRESFRYWREVSTKMWVSLRIAMHVQANESVPEDLWPQVPGWADMTPLFRWSGTHSRTEIRRLAGRLQLEDVVNHWLEWADVRPCLDLSRKGIAFTNLGSPMAGRGLTLSGAIALQLAAASSGTRGATVCSGCHMPYMRSGRSAPARRANYCPSCRKSGVPMREARARYRQKLAEHS